MFKVTEFSGTDTKYVLQKEDFQAVLHNLETECFEVCLTTKSDLEYALNAGCEIYYREIKTEDTIRCIYFVRVPKADIFKYAVHHEN